MACHTVLLTGSAHRALARRVDCPGSPARECGYFGGVHLVQTYRNRQVRRSRRATVYCPVYWYILLDYNNQTSALGVSGDSAFVGERGKEKLSCSVEIRLLFDLSEAFFVWSAPTEGVGVQVRTDPHGFFQNSPPPSRRSDFSIFFPSFSVLPKLWFGTAGHGCYID